MLFLVIKTRFIAFVRLTHLCLLNYLLYLQHQIIWVDALSLSRSRGRCRCEKSWRCFGWDSSGLQFLLNLTSNVIFYVSLLDFNDSSCGFSASHAGPHNGIWSWLYNLKKIGRYPINLESKVPNHLIESSQSFISGKGKFISEFIEIEGLTSSIYLDYKALIVLYNIEVQLFSMLLSLICNRLWAWENLQKP